MLNRAVFVHNLRGIRAWFRRNTGTKSAVKVHSLGGICKGTLQAYLKDFDRDVGETFNRIVKRTAEAENITEKLKATDQIEWLRRMNNIRNRVEEFLLKEFVYQ